jgi:hypothetical protein
VSVRVGLLKYREFHDPILRPVYRALCDAHECLLTANEEELVHFRPHLVIMGEAVAARLRSRMPRALFVHTRHGLASKNVAYKGANETDYLCVTSPFVRDWYIQRKAAPRRAFWIVGYLQMDPLFRGDNLPRPVPVPWGRKTVLYAPTWNPAMSSAPMLGERTIDLIRGRRDDVSIVIKPHPVIATKSPEWMQWWRDAAAADPNVHLVEQVDQDVIPYLKLADVLVTDASSVALEYLATDRPMVLINNRQRFGCRDFDPAGFEWAWRDMGEEVFDADELPGAVDRALTDPSSRADLRARYRALLFGDLTDGRTAERIREHVAELPAVLPLVAAEYVAGWPLRRARGIRRRLGRLWSRPAPAARTRAAATAAGAIVPPADSADAATDAATSAATARAAAATTSSNAGVIS